jgi:peptide/nickel transport system ATP-binding protein
MHMPNEESTTLLAVRNLTVDFRIDRETTLRAVDGISFDVPASATVGLVGESGSGKSVTALAILGLLPQENASIGRESAIFYKGRDLRRASLRELQALRGREVSMIFQEPMSSLNPVFTVGFQLREVLTRHMRLSTRQARARAIELLDEVGIPAPSEKLGAYPHELSGGQQQRVMIAMAIACEPKLLVADEPTTALDVTVQKQILELIAVLQQRHGMSVLFITHDLALVSDIADRVVVMRAGTIREHGPVSRVFEAPQDAYTRALLACRPRPSQRPLRLPVIEDFLEPTGERRPHQERQRGLTGTETPVLEARHLAKSFFRRTGFLRTQEERAVTDASFRLLKGKTLGLVGESGSGKTTVALTLVRLLPATRGAVIYQGADLLTLTAQAMHAFKRKIQIVFQNPYASLNPRFTAGHILLEPMQVHGIGADAADRRDLAYDMLQKVGLPADSFFKYPHEFSGGQRQRIAIARCLTMKPDVLILDESVSALDVSIQAQLLNLLQDLQDEYAMSYLFISHDLAVVKYMSDEVMVMNAGEIVEIGDSDEIYEQPRHPYTRKLLSSMPDVRSLSPRTS